MRVSGLVTHVPSLMVLVSRGYLEGFYYKPRIDLDLLRERSEGLIATSGCLSSMVSRAILDNDATRAWRLVEDFASIFEGRFYLELQRHGIEVRCAAPGVGAHYRDHLSVPVTMETSCSANRWATLARTPARSSTSMAM